MQVKRKAANGGKPDTLPAQSSPEVITLATLAAQARFARLTDKAAVDAALSLWQEAQKALDHKRRVAESSQKHYGAPLAGCRQPNTWPANFKEFLSRVVPGKDFGERELHFAEFVRWKVDNSPHLYGRDVLAAKENFLSEFKAAELSPAAWQTTALEFRRYWAQRKSEARRQAGTKGAAAKADRPGSKKT